MSTLSDLQSAQSRIENLAWNLLLGTAGIAEAIGDALAAPSPEGSPDAIEQVAEYYSLGSSVCDSTAQDVKDVGTDTLPNAWIGAAAETAAQDLLAVSSEVAHMQKVLAKAAHALKTWAGDLRWAQSRDQQGIALLKKAKDAIGWGGIDVFGLASAKRDASAGVDMRVAAAQQVQNGSAQATSILGQLASEARAGRVVSPDIDALASLELASTTNPGKYAGIDAGKILTDTQLSRGSAQLDQMSAADRTEFEQWLVESYSPEEAAYLWKALAAGHNMAELRSFQAAIHPWGDDPFWLASHLTPALNTPASAKETDAPQTVWYLGTDKYGNRNVYDQGKAGDCVSASTVVAQLAMDPTLMLKMTTGGTADGDDSLNAFHKRLDDLYVSDYHRARAIDRQTGHHNKDGVHPDVGGVGLSNSDLGKVDGATYSYTALGDANDRSGVLDGIDQAVDSGKPVPIDTWDGHHPHDGHQMMIIGRDGDELEVYNPWGSTAWVSKSDFVNGQMGMLTSKSLTGGTHIVRGVELPQ